MIEEKSRYEDTVKSKEVQIPKLEGDVSNPNAPRLIVNQKEKPKDTKFGEEELKKIKDLQNSYNSKLIAFGDLKFRKMQCQKEWYSLLEYEKKIEKEYLELQQTEIDLAKELSTKYGEGQLNLATGEFLKNN